MLFWEFLKFKSGAYLMLAKIEIRLAAILFLKN